MGLNQIAFLLMAALSLFGAIGVVFFQSPVRAALSLVLNFFILGLLYFLLGTQLLGISQIMVYAGAIMVLFLFVIMILKSDKEKEKPDTSGIRTVLSFVSVAALAMFLVSQLALPFFNTVRDWPNADYGTPQAIGYTLFTTYVWPFEVVSILLLVGIVGSIMLAKRRF